MKKWFFIIMVSVSTLSTRADDLKDFMKNLCRSYTPDYGGAVALKTNLLLYPALMPNLELEFYLAPRLSLNLEAQYAWWARPSSRQYYRLAVAGPELRYWFGNRGKGRFAGHYAGVYGNFGIYDLAVGNGLGFQGHSNISVGVSYGYMLPIGRRLALEFGVGVGYVSSRYVTYDIRPDCNLYRSTNELNYIGITKAKVNLVWLLGRNRPKR